MTELIATAVITVASAMLFGYWFRYTCLLILSAKTTRDYAGDVAAANQLGFLQVQSQLRTVAAGDLDALQAALDRDYSIVKNLLKQSSMSLSGESSIEARMLEVHYRMMDAWYKVSRQFSAEAARSALEQMSQVVAHFANTLGEQTAGAAA